MRYMQQATFVIAVDLENDIVSLPAAIFTNT